MKYKFIFIIIASIILQGCIGTVTTRVSGDEKLNHHFIGKYPYKAIAVDGSLIGMVGQDAGMCSNHGYGYGIGFGLLGLFSIPLDLCVDTVLLPADIIGWINGWDKNSM